MLRTSRLANVLTVIGLLVAVGSVRWAVATQPVGQPDASGGVRAAPMLGSISIEGAPRLGESSARLALVEFSDFQCSFCGSFARQTLPALKDRYVVSGHLMFVYMHLPLPPIHRFALRAAEAAECAHRQGHFWQLHDLFFARQDEIAASSIRRFALEAGADPARLDECLAGRARAAVAEHTAVAYDLDIRGTPAFFLGYLEGESVRVIRRLQGARPLAEFQQAIDSALATEAN